MIFCTYFKYAMSYSIHLTVHSSTRSLAYSCNLNPNLIFVCLHLLFSLPVRSFIFFFAENGLLSYENPNYHMDPQRIESNSHLYEEILSELQQQNTIRTTGKSHIVSNRKAIARLNIGSMGVDLKEHFHRYASVFVVALLLPFQFRFVSFGILRYISSQYIR